MLINKRKNKFNFYPQKNTLEWMYNLYGISPITPRRCSNGSNYTYLIPKNIKKLINLPINEKIRQVILWKKLIQRNQTKPFHELEKNLNIKTPSYSMDELILEKFPNFSTALCEFLKFIPVFFLVLHKNLLFFRNYDKSKSSIIFFSKLRFFLFESVELDKILMVGNNFKLELNTKGKKIDLLLSKRSIKSVNLKKKKTLKILIDFQEQLALSVLSKIFFFQEGKILNRTFYNFTRNPVSWFNNPIRYYKTIIDISVKHFDKNAVFFNFSSNIKLVNEMNFQLWNFSKNLLFNTCKHFFRGLFFYQDRNFYNPSYETILFLLKTLLCSDKNDRDLIFYFSKELTEKISLISGRLFFTYVMDQVNFGVAIPILPYFIFKEKKTLGSNDRKEREKISKFPFIRAPENLSRFFFDLQENRLQNWKFNLIKGKRMKKKALFSNFYKKFFPTLCFLCEK